MRCIILALVAALALALPGYSDDDGRAHGIAVVGAASTGDAPIKITINPEGRVSATIEGALPSSAPRGVPIVISIGIVNQGFVTARLEAQLVGNPPAEATLDFHPEALKGVPHETRTLRITLTSRAPTDMTIAFRLHDEVPDLGGRDRIHLLMRGL